MDCILPDALSVALSTDNTLQLVSFDIRGFSCSHSRIQKHKSVLSQIITSLLASYLLNDQLVSDVLKI